MLLCEIPKRNFIPYIQLHEFGAFIFSSMEGILQCYDSSEIDANGFSRVMKEFPNPEDINDGRNTAPSKRLKKLIQGYDKSLGGNLILLETGLEDILEKCPRFHGWTEMLIERASS